MSADVIIATALVVVGLAWGLAWALVHIGNRKPAPVPPPARKRYPCAQRDCTAIATRVVLMIDASTEARLVCDHDRDRLVVLGRAIDLGPVDRTQA